ncbi:MULTISPECIES: uracil-DNA glycosylase [Sphingomonas]|uniref:Uracil-DNA glycosylase n=2 Tax=Sphingomonas zeae TaxID=1646122 RepID=A0A7Y6B513_9SPHN|nr:MULTISPECIES: uracil-DNA glycosylase [Sphingomonas]MBB4048241.1 DNA polymerase [Sphingomonas zeae]MDK8186130.1 uracil-DNA glycosylase [Sphingomonas zeae]MDK8215653.1 uracil-DNA glycosylase [Sphingomonas sp. UMB7805-LC452B]NUU46651.1 uracil-DNA glycosylase [Sphingomonas zeae]
MGAIPTFDTAPLDGALAASILDWWHDAGVDLLVEDEPRDWRAPEPARAPALSPQHSPAAAPITAPVALLPDTLEAFLAWRLSDAAPEATWDGVSLTATGPADAALMVLVDCPDREDGEAGQILSGAPGRLFDRMLVAMGQSRETVHIASVCARRPIAGRTPAGLEARLAEIALHHVGLIAPRGLLLLGNAASRAVLGTELTDARGHSHVVDHKSGNCRAVATFHPRFLIEKPMAKAESWKDLQRVMGELNA